MLDSEGDVVLLDLPVRPIVMLGSLKAANDLLDKRSHIYSDRPQSVMLELYVPHTLSWQLNSKPLLACRSAGRFPPCRTVLSGAHIANTSTSISINPLSVVSILPRYYKRVERCSSEFYLARNSLVNISEGLNVSVKL